MLPAGYDIAIEVTNTQQLWLPAQDLPKVILHERRQIVEKRKGPQD